MLIKLTASLLSALRFQCFLFLFDSTVDNTEHFVWTRGLRDNKLFVNKNKKNYAIISSFNEGILISVMSCYDFVCREGQDAVYTLPRKISN